MLTLPFPKDPSSGRTSASEHPYVLDEHSRIRANVTDRRLAGLSPGISQICGFGPGLGPCAPPASKNSLTSTASNAPVTGPGPRMHIDYAYSIWLTCDAWHQLGPFSPSATNHVVRGRPKMRSASAVLPITDRPLGPVVAAAESRRRNRLE